MPDLLLPQLTPLAPAESRARPGGLQQWSAEPVPDLTSTSQPHSASYLPLLLGSNSFTPLNPKVLFTIVWYL